LLVASCLWCIDQVRQAQARQAAGNPPAAVSRSAPPPSHPVKPAQPSAGQVAEKADRQTIKYQ
jgi:hypothetical protein